MSRPNRTISEAPSAANEKLLPKLAPAAASAATYALGAADRKNNAASGRPASPAHRAPARTASREPDRPSWKGSGARPVDGAWSTALGRTPNRWSPQKASRTTSKRGHAAAVADEKS